MFVALNDAVTVSVLHVHGQCTTAMLQFHAKCNIVYCSDLTITYIINFYE